jgi:hypothetical protein
MGLTRRDITFRALQLVRDLQSGCKEAVTRPNTTLNPKLHENVEMTSSNELAALSYPTAVSCRLVAYSMHGYNEFFSLHLPSQR